MSDNKSVKDKVEILRHYGINVYSNENDYLKLQYGNEFIIYNMMNFLLFDKTFLIEEIKEIFKRQKGILLIKDEFNILKKSKKSINIKENNFKLKKKKIRKKLINMGLL